VSHLRVTCCRQARCAASERGVSHHSVLCLSHVFIVRIARIFGECTDGGAGGASAHGGRARSHGAEQVVAAVGTDRATLKMEGGDKADGPFGKDTPRIIFVACMVDSYLDSHEIKLGRYLDRLSPTNILQKLLHVLHGVLFVFLTKSIEFICMSLYTSPSVLSP
jgi:hypothetical protein